jgi:predicted metal-dependent HD superfamily phosphohydrolase
MRAKLYPAWLRLTEPLGVEPTAGAEVWALLHDAYGAPERHYHNLDHLAEVLGVIDELEPLAADPVAVRLAAWFHDAVYDPRASDNEERSAELAERLLAEWEMPPRLISSVRDLVLLTKAHQLASDPDSSVLLDADLAVLGSDVERYSEYASAIRREYAWVGEADYRAGRAGVLRRFLERPRIYSTAPMLDSHEAAARQNIASEIAALESGQSGHRSKTQ